MLEPGDDVGDGVAHPKRIGFLSFGAWHPGGGLTDGAFVRAHHFARQLASPFPLLAPIGVKTSRIEIGAGPAIGTSSAATRPAPSRPSPTPISTHR